MKTIIKSSSFFGILAIMLFSHGFCMEKNSERKYHQKFRSQRDMHQVITPPAHPKLSKGRNIFVTANFIYYRAVQEATEFAYDGVLNNTGTYTPATDPFASVPQGKIASAGQAWAPGFKAGLGFNTGHDDWNLYAEYTYLRFKETTTLSQEPTFATNFLGIVNSATNNVFGSDSVDVAGPHEYSCESMTARWRLNYNKINLDLSRNFYVSKFLTLKPFAGLTGLWQKQTIDTSAEQNYFIIEGVNQTTVDNPTFYENKEMEVFGVGLRSGCNLGWYFTKSFSLVSNMILNAIWTNYHTQTLTCSMFDPQNNTMVTYVNQDNDAHYAIKYVGELELGLRYETYFNHCKNFFSWQVGWDMQTWINWGRFSYTTYMKSGDLSLQGLNVKFRFDF